MEYRKIRELYICVPKNLDKSGGIGYNSSIIQTVLME